MAHREAGDRYRCGECGSTLVYEGGRMPLLL